MKRTVLIFTVDTIPGPDRHVSGGGLRTLGLGEGLKSRGHDVIYSMPKKLVEKGNFPEEADKFAFQPEGLWKTIRKVVPDVILFEQWGLATYLEETNVPVAIDLHGSLIIENYFRQHRNLHYNIAAKIKTLTKADFIICPSQRQKNYFIPWLMLSGFQVDKDAVAVIPVSFSPDMPVMKESTGELTFIFSGGLWPWINPFPALEIVAEQLTKEGKGRLKIFAQQPDLEDLLPKDAFCSGKASNLDAIKDMDRVEMHPFIPHEDLLRELQAADVAVDIYQWNRERELAFSTRTIEFLWSGLPVIHADYSEISHFVNDHQAGWCLNPNDAESINKTVSEILASPSKAHQYGENAQKLVTDTFTWEKTIDPLNDFVVSPPPKSTKRTFFDLVSLEFDRIEEEKDLQLRRVEDAFRKNVRELENREAEITGLKEELRESHNAMLAAAEENEIKMEALTRDFETEKEALHSQFERERESWSGQISMLNEEIAGLSQANTQLQGVIRSIQERVPYRVYKVITYRLKRIWVQYPILIWLLLSNVISNTYMSRWCRKNGIRVFPGQ